MLTPTRSTTRFPCFDGLRALAALAVVAVHTTFVSGFTGRSGLGNYTSRLEIGVSVFFVISGFLLYRPFVAAHFEGRRMSTGGFWIRRLKRIVPAYWVAFVVVTYVLHGDQVRHGWKALAIYLGFAQVYFPHYVLSGITQAWSLCTEMSFYLVLPLWAWFIGRRKRDPAAQLRAELIGLAGWVLVSLAYRSIVLVHHGPLAVTMPNWLPGYADLFALGMLLAVFSSWSRQTGRAVELLDKQIVPYLSWALAAGLFVVVSNIGLPLKPVTPSPIGLSLARQTCYGLFAFFVVLPAVIGPQHQGLVRRVLQTRPLVYLGTVSYGIYLWHESWIIVFLRWTGDGLFTISFPELLLFVVAGATVAASLSYYGIERPIIGGRLRASARPVVDVQPGAPVLAGGAGS